MQFHFDDGYSFHSRVNHRLKVSNRRLRRQRGELASCIDVPGIVARASEFRTGITLLPIAFDLRQSVCSFHIPAHLPDYQVR